MTNKELQDKLAEFGDHLDVQITLNYGDPERERTATEFTVDTVGDFRGANVLDIAVD